VTNCSTPNEVNFTQVSALTSYCIISTVTTINYETSSNYHYSIME